MNPDENMENAAQTIQTKWKYRQKQKGKVGKKGQKYDRGQEAE